MSGEWKKFKDKLEDRELQPRASDWEDMKAIISRHPDLTHVPVYTRSAFRGLMIIIGMAVLGSGIWWLSDGVETSAEEFRNNSKEEIEVPLSKDEPVVDNTGVTPGSTIGDAVRSEKPSGSSDIVSSSVKNKVPVITNTVTAGRSTQKATSDNNLTASISGSGTVYEDKANKSITSSGFSDKEAKESVNSIKPDWNLEPKTVHMETDDSAPSKLLDIPKDEEAESEESFIDPATGFRLGAVNGLLTYSPLVTGDRSYMAGAGIELEFVNNNFTVQAGVYLNNHIRYYQDSIPALDLTPREVSSVDSVWIIDGPFVGHYEYDTIKTTVYDTTTSYRNAEVYPRLAYRYMEVPVMAGYRWYSRSGRWNFDIGAGVIAGWLSYNGSGDESGVKLNSLKLDLALRPAIGFSVNSRWKLLARSGLRYNLLNQTGMPAAEQAVSFPFVELGLSYSW
ncbi:MAG: hypothetical protein ACPF9D_12610 [Owenweeksia sp.]